MNLAKAGSLLTLILLIAPLNVYSQHLDDIYWSEKYAETNGMDGTVWDMVVYRGKLIVAGTFSTAGAKDANLVAAWDGYQWSALGTDNLQGGGIFCLHVYNDKLYAGGYFSIGPPDNYGNENLAVWDGNDWDWVNGRANDTVFAITNFNGDLIVGGAFSNILNATAKVARWDGTMWHRFSNNIDGTVRTIAQYNGSLYVGGDFKNLITSGGGGLYAGSLARWNGTEWQRLSSYISITGTSYPKIYDLMIRGTRLVAVGDFANGHGSGVNLRNMGAGNGSTWSAFGSGVNYARKLYNYEGYLVVGETDGISRWTGLSWEQMAGSETGEITSFCYYNNYHCVGGGFRVLEGDTVNYVASWGPGWAEGFKTGFNGPVYDIEPWIGQLAVCGAFTQSCDGRGYKVAMYNGIDWGPVSSLTNPVLPECTPQALLVEGDTLYMVGAFGYHAYPYVTHLLRFDNQNIRWDQYGLMILQFPDGMNYPTLATAVYNGDIVLGGNFTWPFPYPSLYGFNGQGPVIYGGHPTGTVHAVRTYDDKMLIGGNIVMMAGVPSRGIASWDGVTWSALGEGLHGSVYAIEFLGDLVVAGGSFDSAGGVAANNIAYWDGVNWHPLGEGIDGVVRALSVYDNTLVAGGDFTSAGGIAANNIARWYNSSWAPLGSGLDGGVDVLLAWGWGADTSLYVGGRFHQAGEHQSLYFARWEKYEDLPTAIDDDPSDASLPYSFTLSQNYPNPFNPVTTIEYSLPDYSHVTIEVYNILGQKVQTLLDRDQALGPYTITWDGTDANSRPVATGAYLYRFQAGDHVETRKMLLLK